MGSRIFSNEWIDLLTGVGMVERSSIKEQETLVELSGNFPHSDILLSGKGDLVIQIACAGYGKENISSEVQKNTLVTTFTKVNKFESEEDLISKIKKSEDDIEGRAYDSAIKEAKENAFYYLRKGIKDATSTLKFKVNNERFDLESTEADYKDGILTFTIKEKEKYNVKKIIKI